MTILVVGSVAYDSVKTAMGSREDALGGSATYASIAASYFAPVGIVAVVGADFVAEDRQLLTDHHVDISGLKTSPGRTFRWAGEYDFEDVNSRKTLDTQLNVFADFEPELTPQHRTQPYLFLGNIQPELQLNVLDQMEDRPQLVAADTMNLWIESERETVTDVIRAVDVLFMDENEVRLFTGEANVVKAAKSILTLGPRTVVVKRGDHGVIQFMGNSVFAAPAYPLETVADPTGAGDSFAGGFMGYLAATGDLGPAAFRRAAVLGSVMGSLAVESFSLDRLSVLTLPDLIARFQALTELSSFEGLSEAETLPWRPEVTSGG